MSGLKRWILAYSLIWKKETRRMVYFKCSKMSLSKVCQGLNECRYLESMYGAIRKASYPGQVAAEKVPSRLPPFSPYMIRAIA